MTYHETVYADWTALRTAVPVTLGLIVLATAGFVGFRMLRSEPELASQPIGAEIEVEPIEQAATLDPQQAAQLVADDFIDRLPRADFSGLTFAFSDPDQVLADFTEITVRLGPFQLAAAVEPVQLVDQANATAPVRLDWELGDGTVFDTTGELDLVLVGTEWQVDWESSIIETSLDPGDALVSERVVAPRAPIFGRDGFPLIDNRPVVDVGVLPRQVTDVAALSQSLGQLTGLDPAEIQAKIGPSPSDTVVTITSRRAEDLAPIEAQLASLPGVVLEPSTFPLPPDDRFARALLGRSAEVTAEIIDEAPELFIAGDIAGRSGLQREYNTRLAGRPGFQVRVKRRFPTAPNAPPPTATPSTVEPGTETTIPGGEGSQTTTADGATPPGSSPDPAFDPTLNPDIVYIEPPVEGTPLNLTIDQRVQTAAENALAGTELVSALVAVEVSTGHILAAANGPGAAANNFALLGQYAPGSIFKTVTAYAVMERGYGLNDPVDCPFALDVNGRQFTNAEGEVLGIVPMQVAYVLSCNTAFINLSSVLEPSDFPNSAARFGIGVDYSLGTAAFSGSVPTPGGPVRKAATSFGQSQVLVSPLSAAVMAATAAGGAYRPPTLVLEPDRQPAPDQPLDPNLAANLQQLMRAVVTNGTGRAVAGVAGGPVSGKTGTAEFGDADPPQAHAWFIGFQGDIAFAVFVEGGEFGGATAAPIAGAFLNQLAGQG